MRQSAQLCWARSASAADQHQNLRWGMIGHAIAERATGIVQFVALFRELFDKFEGYFRPAYGPAGASQFMISPLCRFVGGPVLKVWHIGHSIRLFPLFGNRGRMLLLHSYDTATLAGLAFGPLVHMGLSSSLYIGTTTLTCSKTEETSVKSFPFFPCGLSIPQKLKYVNRI